MREDIYSLLYKINVCEARGYPQTRKNIYIGCYDVWDDVSDRDQYRTIMEANLEEAKNLELIIDSEIPLWGKVWNLTEQGKNCLEEYQSL